MEMGIHPKISIGRQLWMGQHLVGGGREGLSNEADRSWLRESTSFFSFIEGGVGLGCCSLTW